MRVPFEPLSSHEQRAYGVGAHDLCTFHVKHAEIAQHNMSCVLKSCRFGHSRVLCGVLGCLKLKGYANATNNGSDWPSGPQVRYTDFSQKWRPPVRGREERPRRGRCPVRDIGPRAAHLDERNHVARKKNANGYGEDAIKVLEGLDPVRKRPGMYIGSTSASGLHHLVWEIVDNSVDEAMAGFCSKITVTVHVDGSVTVTDNGRGIPVGRHPQKRIPTLEVVLTVLHAGGKFDNDAYKVSGGLHGVGVSVVNALSSRLVAEVKRDGGVYRMEFSRGKTTQKMQKVGDSKTTGTSITFWPDEEIFETTTFSYDTLHDHLQETAFLNKNLRIVLTDERELEPRKDEFCYAGGIIDFVKFLNEEKSVQGPMLNGEITWFSVSRVLRNRLKAKSLFCVTNSCSASVSVIDFGAPFWANAIVPRRMQHTISVIFFISRAYLLLSAKHVFSFQEYFYTEIVAFSCSRIQQ